MNICMAGAAGRMGRRILEMAAAEGIEAASAIEAPAWADQDIAFGAESGATHTIRPVADAAAAIDKADVIIDFTNAEAALANAHIAAAAGKPIVIGATGLSAEQQAELAELARNIPIVFAPNMSVGVNLLFKLAGEVAAALGLDYNVEITEIHHNQKKDSPSGTAVRLAERVAEALELDYAKNVAHGREGMVGARPKNEIGMHALRGGDVVGEHTVAYIGHGERIELTHKAHSRDNFAKGALRAARFATAASPGLYDMQDVLGLK